MWAAQAELNQWGMISHPAQLSFFILHQRPGDLCLLKWQFFVALQSIRLFSSLRAEDSVPAWGLNSSFEGYCSLVSLSVTSAALNEILKSRQNTKDWD